MTKYFSVDFSFSSHCCMRILNLSYWRVHLTEYFFSEIRVNFSFFCAVCNTVLRQIIPFNETMESLKSNLATPSAPASTFPKSPACLSPLPSVGAPCSHESGLKWGPAEVHPSKNTFYVMRNLNVLKKYLPVLSPKVWTWNPCWPGASPEISPVTETGPSPWNDELKYDKSLYELLIFRQGNCNLTKTGSPIRWLEIRLK